LLRLLAAGAVLCLPAANAQTAGSAIETIPVNDAPTQVLQAFLHCDAQFFTALSAHADRVVALKAWVKPVAAAPNSTVTAQTAPTVQTVQIARIAVPNRSTDEGQNVVLAPPYTVHGVPFVEFIDEINTFTADNTADDSASDRAKANAPKTAYYWGFNTDAKLAAVLPVLQSLLPLNRKLTADGSIWARIDVFERGAWRGVAQHSDLKGKPAALPERALIVETHEGGGTRVVCGLQAAPLPAAELKKLRPDL
jgi:hypothetical protein